MNAVSSLVESLQQLVALGGFVFLRIGSAMALLPAFGERSVPARLRLVLSLCFTVIVASALDPNSRALAREAVQSPGLCLGEVGIGLVLGLSLRLTIMVLQMAGTIIAQSVSLSQVFASAGTEPMTVIGEFLVLAAISLAVTLDLHVEIARSMLESYRDFPPGTAIPSGDLLTWALTRGGGAFRFAFALAMPFVAGALIFNLALGILNKAMPQLMVAMVGAPALTLGGLALLMLCAPLILSRWIDHFVETLGRPF